jgi:RimJ/RimL family protein N-acetyltransferase
MKLEALTLADMEQIRGWRENFAETLRTPYKLTKEMQEDYYLNTICNRNSTTRYWALVDYSPADVCRETAIFSKRYLLGYGGIEHISWENSNGEMSLLIDPARQGQGLGEQAVALFLEQAFHHLNLHTVYGECYQSGPWRFWERMVDKYEGYNTFLPLRKYHAGEYWASYYFTFTREMYDELQ